MSRVLGINAVFHDPAAALVVDGETVAAAEEERYSRRKHGKQAVPFSAWELPVAAAKFCLGQAGIAAEEVDAVTYSYDPALAKAVGATTDELIADEWEGLRTLYAERAPRFLAAALLTWPAPTGTPPCWCSTGVARPPRTSGGGPAAATSRSSPPSGSRTRS